MSFTSKVQIIRPLPEAIVYNIGLIRFIRVFAIF